MSQSQRARITRLENRVATFAAARVTASDTETGADEDGYLERGRDRGSRREQWMVRRKFLL